MRTTLRIDDDLFRELKERAGRKGLTLSQFVGLALRQSLAAEDRPRKVFRQKTYDLGRPSFDITRSNAVAAALEDEVLLQRLTSPS